MRTAILFLGALLAAPMTASSASANDGCYDDCDSGYSSRYGDGYSYRYDDQADQTRELNLMQLDNPGAGEAAVPGSPYYGDYDNTRLQQRRVHRERRGYYSDDEDRYAPQDEYQPGDEADDDDAYDDGAYDDGAPYDDGAAPYDPYEDDK